MGANFISDLDGPICLPMDGCGDSIKTEAEGNAETMWRKILEKREIMKRTQADKRKSQRIGRWKRCSMDGEREKRKKARKRESKEQEREREKQLSSCPSPHAARTPPWGGLRL